MAINRLTLPARRSQLEDLTAEEMVQLADEVRRECIRRDVRATEGEFWMLMEQDVQTPEEWIWTNRFRIPEMYERAERAMTMWTERAVHAEKLLKAGPSAIPSGPPPKRNKKAPVTGPLD